jgi:hypothetical protein
VEGGDKADQLTAELGLDLPEPGTWLPFSYIKLLRDRGIISKDQQRILFTSIHCREIGSFFMLRAHHGW